MIVEGEKDADRLAVARVRRDDEQRRRRQVAARNLGASRAAGPSYVIADNDDAGRSPRRDVARKLHGIAASVRILELPGLPEKGDVSDWLDAGHTVDELRAVLLAAPLYVPADVRSIGGAALVQSDEWPR